MTVIKYFFSVGLSGDAILVLKCSLLELAENQCPVKHNELPVCTFKIRNDLRSDEKKINPFFFIFFGIKGRTSLV